MNIKNQLFAYVLACGDPAIKIPLTRNFDNRLGPKGYFWLPELGGVKNIVSPQEKTYRDYVLQKIRDAQNVHPFGLILLVNHSQCGAYKLARITFEDSQKEEAFHAEELKKAEEVLKKEFPELVVERHYFLKDKQRLAW